MLILLLACAAPKDDTGAAPVSGATPTAITATPSEAIATVLRVTWHTDTPTGGYVAFGEDEDYALETPAVEVGTDHEVLLLGMPASTDVHFSIFAEDEAGELAVSDDQVARTGDLPGVYPDLARTGDPDPYGGVIALPLLGTVYAASFIDTDGRIVWYHAEDRGYAVQRVRLARDGRSVLYNAVWLTDLTPNGEIVRVSLDGNEVTSTPAPYNTHDFVELPDGTFCAITTAFGKLEDGTDVYGDELVEIAPDGASHVVWSAFDSYDPVTEPSLNNSDATWTHFNALHYSPDDDTYVVSIRNFNSLVKVDRQGSVVWTLGGWHDEFAAVGDTTRTVGQHGFQLLGDELIQFDNGPGETASSRAVRFRFDEAGRTIEETWSYHHDPAWYIWAMGDVEERQDGGVRVTWSTAGVMDQLGPDGAPEWSLAGEFGTIFGYTSRLPSLYAGAEAPY